MHQWQHFKMAGLTGSADFIPMQTHEAFMLEVCSDHVNPDPDHVALTDVFLSGVPRERRAPSHALSLWGRGPRRGAPPGGEGDVQHARVAQGDPQLLIWAMS